MRLLLLLVYALVISFGPSLVHAETGRCVIQVKQKPYLSGTCEIKVNDNHGSFSVGAGEKHRSRYFAYVNMEEDGAHGYWNETPDSSHAHTSLGILKRDGACWKNEMARVCASK